MPSTIKTWIRQTLHSMGYRLERIRPDHPVIPSSIDPVGVELLADQAFQSSCRDIAGLTLLDLPRLGNLWQFCQMSNPDGNLIEIGSYRGGGALHISNSSPARKIFVCDSFEGFKRLDAELDDNFSMTMFRDTGVEAVRRLFTSRQRDAQVVKGFFPDSCRDVDIGQISFAHVDVDIYQATLDTLNYLAPRMAKQSVMILDDYRRRAKGVDQAVREFTQRHPDWLSLPLFPSQAALIHSSWFM